jgi:hypothetical protein
MQMQADAAGVASVRRRQRDRCRRGGWPQSARVWPSTLTI